MIAILGAVIGLAAFIVPAICGVRKDIVALGERMSIVELGLVERIARLEVATEGFVKLQSTPH